MERLENPALVLDPIVVECGAEGSTANKDHQAACRLEAFLGVGASSHHQFDDDFMPPPDCPEDSFDWCSDLVLD